MLFLVATPIGNLSDISLRALETLRTVDIVASEDTRKTGMLLKHFEISRPLMSFHDHNEEKASDRILELLRAGKKVAVVTDAGTPGIADPGYRVIRKAIDADLPLTMIPGPTGLIMALVLSGLAVHAFTFRGFPPRKAGPRKRFFGVDRRSPHTLLFYESPHRLEASVRDALEVFGDRPAALANDLTKKFEKMERGLLSELLASVGKQTLRGEYILVVSGLPGGSFETEDEEEDEAEDDRTDVDASDRDGDEYEQSGVDASDETPDE
jgi:16S rRNA (cytidine1402-2'-O)-methyltransferase